MGVDFVRSAGTILFLVASAYGSPADAQVIEPFDADQVIDILQSEGYRAKLGTGPEEKGLRVKSAISGISYDLKFDGCDEIGASCDVLLFESGWDFPDDEPASATAINEWNRTMFGKAFLDEVGDPWLSFELHVSGGLSRVNFLEALALWDVLLKDFTQKFDIG